MNPSLSYKLRVSTKVTNKENMEVEPKKDDLNKESYHKRSKNFREEEIKILLDLVCENKYILENKKNDRVTVKEKEQMWKLIEKSFNGSSGVYRRDWKTLKNKYENLKKTTKRKYAEEKKNVIGIGGDPSQPSVITEIDTKMKELIGNVQVLSRSSEFDPDATAGLEIISLGKTFVPTINLEWTQLSSLQEEKADAETEQDIENNMVEEVSPASVNIDEMVINLENESSQVSQRTETLLHKSLQVGFVTHPSGTDLQANKSPPLKVRKKKSLPFDSSIAGRRTELLSKHKEELLKLQKISYKNQIKHQEVEHKLRVQFLKEEHEQKMKLLKLKIKKQELEIEENNLGLLSK